MKMLSFKEVCAMVGVSSATLNRMFRIEGTFPQPKRIAKRRIAWLESDVKSWMKAL